MKPHGKDISETQSPIEGHQYWTGRGNDSSSMPSSHMLVCVLYVFSRGFDLLQPSQTFAAFLISSDALNAKEMGGGEALAHDQPECTAECGRKG